MVADTKAAAPAGVMSAAEYAEGIRAGLIGAATIALWFLVLDTLNGRAFYTPTVLGHVVFKGGAGLAEPASISPSLDMVLAFTWIHGLIFVLIGLFAARLLALAERDPNYGFGVLLLFVVFLVGFVAVCMVAAEPVLQALTIPAVLGGNLLAAGAMALVFRRHRQAVTALP